MHKKRFTDAFKWQDKWFRRLDVKYKLLWIYILDNCSNAGIWEVDLDHVQYYTGFEYPLKEAEEIFKDRIVLIDDKWFIPKFIEFQYGRLTPDCYPHRPVINELEKYQLIDESLNLINSENKGINRVVSRVQEKEEEKEKEKDIPTEEEFLEYARTLEVYHPSLDFQIRAKYKAWFENGWRDGHNKKIKKWKTKLQNTISYFKKDYGTDKKQAPRGSIDFDKWGSELDTIK